MIWLQAFLVLITISLSSFFFLKKKKDILYIQSSQPDSAGVEVFISFGLSLAPLPFPCFAFILLVLKEPNERVQRAPLSLPLNQ